MFKDWKTTSVGLGLICTGLTGLLHAVTPEVPGPDLSTAFSSILGGVGLIFAGDAKK